MSSEVLFPVTGCWVKRLGSKEPLGQVEEVSSNGLESRQVKVHWGQGKSEWLGIGELESDSRPIGLFRTYQFPQRASLWDKGAS